MKSKTNKITGRPEGAMPVLILAFALLGIAWACNDPHAEYVGAEKPTGGTPTSPENGGQRMPPRTDTAQWRDNAAASYADLGNIAPDFSHGVAQQVRISVIRFRLAQPAEVVISHCASNLASTALLLVDSVRQTIISSEDGALTIAACSNPALGQVRVVAQAGVYYAVGYVAGTVQVDISKLLGLSSPTLITMQTNAVTGTLRTDMACSPLPLPVAQR
jgi:hypothetical protein